MTAQGTVIVQDIEEGVLADKAVEILKVATELFYERDFNSVGMRMIASQSGEGSISLSLLRFERRDAFRNCFGSDSGLYC